MDPTDNLTHLAESTESGATLMLLALNSSPRVRRATASNLRCPPLALTALSVDSDMRTRAAVASHSRTPHYVIQRYVDDSTECVSVRYLAILNEHSFVERLTVMTLDQLNAYSQHADLSYARAALHELSKRQRVHVIP